ncbi:MAG: DNA topoisomerase VI subunit B, partial [Nitrospira sp.]|nr:DNA topoisomerase VI subunit B [Nitrospira sp.]
NRLKGGKLPKEKLKAQLQKIATSRTGGLKTDEALGKTNAGPEGLPHSIIVTEEGIEGEVDLAARVQADTATASVETNLLGDEQPVEKQTTAQEKKSAGVKGRDAKLLKGEAAQLAPFKGPDRPDKPKKPSRPNKPDKRVSGSRPRGKK